jgi:hypothetical protein
MFLYSHVEKKLIPENISKINNRKSEKIVNIPIAI